MNDDVFADVDGDGVRDLGDDDDVDCDCVDDHSDDDVDDADVIL